MNHTLRPVPPYDFEAMLRRPLSRPSRGIVVDPVAGTLAKVVRLSNKAVPVYVSSQGSTDDPTLVYTHPDGLSPAESQELERRMEHMLSIARHPGGFYDRIASSPAWARLIDQYRGLRLLCDDDLFESLVKIIVGQQLTVRFAAVLVGRLIEYAGEVVVWDKQTLPVFPSPERVAALSYQELRRLSYSQRKAEYVIDTARAVVEGRLDLERFRDMEDSEVSGRLVQERGVGRWTVECFLLFGLGRPDILPAADIGVQNAIQRLLELPERPLESEVRMMSGSWAPWRSFATYYLWQSLISVGLESAPGQAGRGRTV